MSTGIRARRLRPRSQVELGNERSHITGGPGFGGAAGTSLVEVLMWTAVFAMLATVAYSVFFNVVRLSAMNATALDRLRAVEDVREAFSRTVRESSGIVEGVGIHKTGADTVVLRLPPSAESRAARRYVVFGRVFGQKPLAKLEVAEENGQYTATAFQRYPVPVNEVRLGFDTANPVQARRVSLDIEVPNVVRGKSKPPVAYEFVAALRNEGAGMP